MEKESKIYVAGHRGLVGGRLMDRLCAEGYSDIVTAESDRLDLRDEQAVRSFFEINRPEYVFLVAARHGGISEYAKYPVEMLADNCKMEINVIMNCLKHNVKKLIFVAASCVYCQDSPVFTEDALYDGWVQQSTEPYALAKAVGIKLCDYCNREYGTKFVSLLPANIYGLTDEKHHDRTSVIPAMLDRFANAAKNNLESEIVWGTGKTRREFLHVKDFADAMVKVMNSDIDGGWVNAGYGSTVTINDLAETIADVTGFKGRIEHDLTKPGGTDRRALDITKLRGTGWEPKVSLKEGLTEMYEHLYGKSRG